MPRTKFNINSKTKDFFFIRKYLVDTSKHPIIQSRKTCKFRLKTLISQQEENMLIGLTNTLQCNRREAIRIAFYEACRRGSKAVEECVPYASRYSKDKAHVGRSRPLTVALPNSEKQELLKLAKELGLSEKEVFRLAFIWLQYGFRYNTITRIEKCQIISQDRIAEEWSKANQGLPPNPRTAKLKQRRDEELEILRLIEDEGIDLFPIENTFHNNYALHVIGKEKEFFQQYILEKYNYLWDKNPSRDKPLPKDFKTMKFLDKKILGAMYALNFTREECIKMYYEDKKEVENLKRMDRTEFLELLRKKKEEEENRTVGYFEPTSFEDIDTDFTRHETKESRTEYCKRIIDSFFKSFQKTNTP